MIGGVEVCVDIVGIMNDEVIVVILGVSFRVLRLWLGDKFLFYKSCENLVFVNLV